MEQKQTAVDWLEEQLYSSKELDLAGVIQQAKEMEKQQMIDAMDIAYNDGIKTGHSIAIEYNSPYESWEQYYNEEYGK